VLLAVGAYSSSCARDREAGTTRQPPATARATETAAPPASTAGAATTESTETETRSGETSEEPAHGHAFWSLAKLERRIGRLARGRDTAATAPVLLADGSVEVFFDRYDFGCRTGASDIYKFVIPAP
jgi:hypothetical protein